MAYSIACPQCQAKLVVKNDKLIGKNVACPKCKSSFVVTPPPAAEPAPSAVSQEPLGPETPPMDVGQGASGDPGLPAWDDGAGAAAGPADLADVDLGEVSTSLPQQPALATTPRNAPGFAAQPAPGRSPADAGASRKVLFLGMGIGSGATALLFGLIWVIGTLVGSSSGDRSAAGSGSGGSAGNSGGATAPTSDSSPVLLSRLKEHYTKQHRADRAGASDAEIAKSVEQAIANEIAANRKFVVSFLQLTPENEGLLKSGKPAKNSKERLALLQQAFREAGFQPPRLPGPDLSAPGASENPVDAELMAHYLEVGLLREVFAREGDTPEFKYVAAELVRSLRDDDLLQTRNFGELAGRAQQTAKVKRNADLRKAAASDLTVDVRPLSLNNLKQIALAFHNYHDVYKTFPAAVQTGPKQVPRSWRVTILPFLENLPLYQKYRQDEPWDSAHNKALLAEIPEVFRSPRAPANSTNTAYSGFSPPDDSASPAKVLQFAPALGGTRGINMAQITDGTSNTLLVVEANLEVPWTKPEDIPFDESRPVPFLGGIHQAGFCAALCDGSAGFIPDAYDRDMLKRLIGRSDGQQPKPPW